MSRSTHQEIALAIDALMTRGAQKLYDKYINSKLPNDCSQKVTSEIETNADLIVLKDPLKNRINRQIMPKPGTVDRITPQKVPIRSKSEINIPAAVTTRLHHPQLVLVKKQFYGRKQKLHSAKPNFCIKYSCIKGQVDHFAQKKRNENEEQIVLQQKAKEEQATRLEQNICRRKNLQSKIKELCVEGIPYFYDDSGNLIMPDVKQWKKELETQSKKKIIKNSDKPFSLRYKALQILSEGSNFQGNSQISGRKKGFYSNKVEKKRKIDDQDFNNNHQRQFSSIPYMDIENGIKIVERQRNIMAQKIHQPNSNRQSYISELRNSGFKSYLPQSSSTIDLEKKTRPSTHSGSRKKNSMSLGLQSATSLRTNLRPRTTESTNKVSINNRELAVELIDLDKNLSLKLFI